MQTGVLYKEAADPRQQVAGPSMAYVQDTGRPPRFTELPREMLFAAPALSLAMAGRGGWAELAPLARFGTQLPAGASQPTTGRCCLVSQP